MTKKQISLKRRKHRVRASVIGVPERPRLSVYRSLSHIYAQIIDDTSCRTLVSAEDREVKKPTEGGKTALARELGGLIAEKAKKVGITKVVFDRGGRAYHGRIAALAEGARAGGLQF